MERTRTAGETAPHDDRADALTEWLDRVGEELARAGLERAVVARPHPLVVVLLRDDRAVAIAPSDVWDRSRSLLEPFASRIAEGRAMLVVAGHPQTLDLAQARSAGIAAITSDTSPHGTALAAIRALELVEARRDAERGTRGLERYRYELDELTDIARAMTTERNVEKLLGVILEKSRLVTGADAGSIYVVETDMDGDGYEDHPSGSLLRFKLSQNDSVHYDSREFVMPMSTRSIAGSAAIGRHAIRIDDAYELGPDSPFGFDQSFDRKIGYRTKSMLAMPLISQRDEVIGVIQLINKKTDPSRKLESPADVEAHVVPFDARSEELLGMVAAQAGVSLENAMLYYEIRRLFEGFVNASVEAIESRDPTTSGHSRRVADLTVELAKVVDSAAHGSYKDTRFGVDDLRELEYASLLHDFGKIGVREKVLVKAKKLYDERLELIRGRFDFAARSVETDVLRRKVALLERGAPKSELDALDLELETRRAELEASWQTILSANEPSVLAAGDFAKIGVIASQSYVDALGRPRMLLENDEALALSVKKGSLTAEEYEEISSHVVHTFKFLSRIPWGKALRRVPQIAGAHHERLNGTGYPNRLHADEIPVQSKMMSIADIFDALTASDRPYKRAVPVDKAVEILDFGVKDQHLDPELVRIFRDARVWERCTNSPK